VAGRGVSGPLAGNLATDFVGFVLAEAGADASPERLIVATLDAVALALDDVGHAPDGPRRARALLLGLLDQVGADEQRRWGEHRKRREGGGE
jgi:hypothetical protein